MHISVVIPTFNRAGLLRQSIAALAGQQLDDGCTYEVIFVSNGSSDDSAAILKQAVADHPGKFRYHYIPPSGGPSRPRNVGIRAATGEVVIIIDDDVIPDPDLVLRHAEFHRRHPEPHHAALGELYVPPHLLDDPMSLFHSFPYHELRDLDRLSFLHFWTCNVSVKREFMLAAGMFDETFLWYEDIICGHRLCSHGMHLHFLPAARGQHLHQLKAQDVPTKGLFYGRWLYPVVERLTEREVKERFGVLSTEFPPGLLAARLVKRAAFILGDNPLTMAALRLFGAAGAKRSRLTDLYHYIVFRRNVLAGYREAKHQTRNARRSPTARSHPLPPWIRLKVEDGGLRTRAERPLK